MLLVIGNAAFQDTCRPLKGKNEWGVDTLIRKVRGDRALAEDYIAALTQGDTYALAGSTYYLQSWEADDDPIFATVTLTYKGLATGELPAEDVQSDILLSSGQTSADYSLENDGKGRVHRTQVLWKFSYNIPSEGGETDVATATRDVYCVSAVMEFTYKAIVSRYRYITDSEPAGPIHDSVALTFSQGIEKARILTSDGAVYGPERASAFGLTPEPIVRVLSFSSRHIIGTTFYECEDVVRAELGNAE